MMSCFDAHTMLDAHLTRELPPSSTIRLRTHLDHCGRCWRAWNRLRWDHAAGTPLYAELVEYLGDRFIPYLDSSRALADAWDRAAPCTTEQVRRFYRDTDAYLYNQVIWHASGNRPRYVDAALPLLAAHREALILDYGCGIGEDILALHHAGHRVIGCDLPSPPTDFLAWRATRHQYPHRVLHPDELPALSPPAILWIMDALDHVPDVSATLDALLSRVRLVVTEDQRTHRGHGRQSFHYRRPLREIDNTFASFGLTRMAPSRTPAPLAVWIRRE